MNTRLLNIWTKIHSSFWFVPSLMVLAAFALSFAMIGVDEITDDGISKDLGWIYTNKPEGAREVLSTIAGSMITVAGVVFSITIVALSLASQQFGPRLLSSFMRDTGNQIVLGTFISTYFYCLLILRTIRSGDETQFVPHFSVAVGVLLAIASLGVLIYFIHHVAESIQVSTVISKVDKDYDIVVKRLFPARLGKATGPAETDIPENLRPRNCQPVCGSGSGYLQAIDQEKLLELSNKHDLILKMLIKPGDYVVIDQQLAELYGLEPCSKEVLKRLAGCFLLGKERTFEQDVMFLVNQLIEIALRALSPSINDPFTATACLNRLTNGLCELAGREFPSIYRKNDEGQLRIIALKFTFQEVLQHSFEQIRMFAKTNPRLMHYMLQCYAKIAARVKRIEDINALQHEAKRTLDIAIAGADEEELKRQFQTEYSNITALLKDAKDKG